MSFSLSIINSKPVTFLQQVLGGSLFLALLAQCAIPLPFTCVPLTLQTVGVLMIGGLLGSQRGFLSILAYICEGAMGFPVFASGGAGLGILVGPKGGYFLGFLIAAYFVGKIVEKNKNRLHISGFLIAELIILSVGSLWLSLFVGPKYALSMGFLPFIFCGIIKAITAAFFTKKMS